MKKLLGMFVVCAGVLLCASVCRASQIDEINAAIAKAGAGWTAGETPLAFMNMQDRRQHLGLLSHSSEMRAQLIQENRGAATRAAQVLPSVCDWRSMNGGNYVTPIKNQAYCGSCWSFAGTAALESAVLISARMPGLYLDLSEQTLVSCMGTMGCSGGYLNDAFTFFEQTGTVKESCYGYKAIDEPCSRCEDWENNTFRARAWQWITYADYGDLSALKSAIYAYGPSMVAFRVFEDFDYYTTGVYSHVWGEYLGDHAVLAVGWDDYDQALIIKNSWGPDWGEDGYFRIAYSELLGDTQFASNAVAMEQVEMPANVCLLTAISPRSRTVEASGGAVTIQVQSPDACSWSARTSQSWVTIASGGSGSGAGSVTLTIAANEGRENRTATVFIGSEQFNLVQGPWVTQTVDAAGAVGKNTAIAVDAQGHVHLAYQDMTGAGLRYATNASGAWVTQEIDSVGMPGNYRTSIAVDSQGFAHIAYYAAQDLKYATNASGAWLIDTADYAGDVGSYPSIALDGAGRAYISFYESLNTEGGRLKLATNRTGTWQSTVIDDTGAAGQYTSLAVDAAGALHIAYYEATDKDKMLKYATNASGDWELQYVDKESDSGVNASLGLDSLGKAHISYFWKGPDEFSGELHYATNAKGSWEIQVIDGRTGYAGSYSALAVDRTGKAHVAYYYATTSDLRYATNAAGAWVVQEIDVVHSTGSYTSIAMDVSGNVHIGYYDSSHSVLKYATDKSGVKSSFTLMSRILGSGRGAVTSSSSPMDCSSGNCKTVCAQGAKVTLQAVPQGSVFAGWGGACSGQGECTVTMDDNVGVSATFVNACPAVVAAEDNRAGIELLRQLRDRVLKATPAGRASIAAYYRHAPEVAAIIGGHAVLKKQAAALIAKLLPFAQKRIAGQRAALPSSLQQDILIFCDAVSASAGQELQKTIRQFKANIRQTLNNVTIEEDA